jgi:hypothetical protein
MLSGGNNNSRKISPHDHHRVIITTSHGQDMREHSYTGSVAAFSDIEERAQGEGIISLKTPKDATGVAPVKLYSKSSPSRDFYLSTTKPTRTSFAAALREDEESLKKLSEVIH